MSKIHQFELKTVWTGNNGTGTDSYTTYRRDHTVSVAGKADLLCSADPVFRGDGSKHNPEDMLIVALSGCHMLWYLHLCADKGIIVTAYEDNASGILDITGGKFVSVTLKPTVSITDISREEEAKALHHEANKKCFIANSCNFPVTHQVQIVQA